MLLNYIAVWWWMFKHGYDVIRVSRPEFQLMLVMGKIKRAQKNYLITCAVGIGQHIDIFAEKMTLPKATRLDLIALFQSYATEWEHFSGDPLRPVPTEEFKLGKAGTHDMWYHGEYAKLRMELVDFIIERAKIDLLAEYEE